MILTEDSIEKIKNLYFKENQSTNKVEVFFNFDDIYKKTKLEHLYILPIKNNLVHSIVFHSVKNKKLVQNILNLNNDKIFFPCLNQYKKFYEIDYNCPFCIGKNIYNLDYISTVNNYFTIFYENKTYYILFSFDFCKNLINNIKNKDKVIYYNVKENRPVIALKTEDYIYEIEKFDNLSVLKIFQKKINLILDKMEDIIEFFMEELKNGL